MNGCNEEVRGIDVRYAYIIINGLTNDDQSNDPHARMNGINYKCYLWWVSLFDTVRAGQAVIVKRYIV